MLKPQVVGDDECLCEGRLKLVDGKAVENAPAVVIVNQQGDVGESQISGDVQGIQIMQEGNITEEELNNISVVDKPEEAVEIIENYYRKYSLKPNF